MEYQSKRTVISMVILISMLITGIVFLNFGIKDVRQNIFLGVFALSIGVITLTMSLLGFTNKVTVNLKSIGQRNIFTKRKVFWKDVQSIHLDNNAFGGYNTILKLYAQKDMIIISSLAGMSNELTKAIIEAALSANPSIKLEGFWSDVFGPPPYGIFTKKDK